MSTSAYGSILTGDDVHAAVAATISTWAPSYVAEMSRQKGIVLPAIRNFGNEQDITPNLPIDAFPVCVIVTPGTTSPVEVRGDGTVAVWWALGVGVVVADVHYDAAQQQAHLYTGLLRTLLLQQRALGGLATDTRLESEDVSELAWNTDHTVFSGRIELAVRLTSIANRSAGPATPPADPLVADTLPTVATTGIALTKVPVTKPV